MKRFLNSLGFWAFHIAHPNNCYYFSFWSSIDSLNTKSVTPWFDPDEIPF